MTESDDLAAIRAAVESHGVHGLTEADLEAIRQIVAATLPSLAELQATLPADVLPAGRFAPLWDPP